MKPAFIRIGLLGLSIPGISLLHYLTPLHLHYLHDIFQRFYYLPIILAALWFGFRSGLACSLVVSIVYALHILLQWGVQPPNNNSALTSHTTLHTIGTISDTLL